MYYGKHYSSAYILDNKSIWLHSCVQQHTAVTVLNSIRLQQRSNFLDDQRSWSAHFAEFVNESIT